jgi:hypothetical protein
MCLFLSFCWFLLIVLNIPCSFLALFFILKIWWWTVLKIFGSFLVLLAWYSSSGIYSFRFCHDFVYLSSFSCCSTQSRIFCNVKLLVMNFISLCLSWNVFTSLILQDNLAGYSKLGWQLLFFRISNTSFHAYLPLDISARNLLLD